jgi:hypothetical protein
MPIAEIFKGIKLMDEDAETLWKCITDNFGHEFFLPLIDKLYSHLFVNDVSKHEASMGKAINQTKMNEETLLFEYQKTLKLIQKEKLDIMTEFLNYKADTTLILKNATLEGFERGKSLV